MTVLLRGLGDSLALLQHPVDEILLQHPVDEVPDPGLVHLVTHHGRKVKHQASAEELLAKRQTQLLSFRWRQLVRDCVVTVPR